MHFFLKLAKQKQSQNYLKFVQKVSLNTTQSSNDLSQFCVVTLVICFF